MNDNLPIDKQDIDDLPTCSKCEESGITEDGMYCDCGYGQARAEDESFKYKEE